MTSYPLRAARILAPTDLRLIHRDGPLMILLAFGTPLMALACRWLVPFLNDFLAPWLDLEPYYGLIVAGIVVGNQPATLGVVAGILFIEERDAGTLRALQATPLSLRGFLGYRIVAAIVLSIFQTAAGVLLIGLVSVPWPVVAAAALIASLGAPVVALAYVIFFKNKVQALTAIKLVQSWGILPAALYFAPSPWPWLGGLVAPLYYPMRLFWTAADGRPEWWLVVPGVLVPLALLYWLLRRFERTVFS